MILVVGLYFYNTIILKIIPSCMLRMAGSMNLLIAMNFWENRFNSGFAKNTNITKIS